MKHLRIASTLREGFTLVEMMVIAPIVILMIGGFIALIVNLTGEVMSSRGASLLAYDIQDALNRIEDDIKLSTTYLAVNNVDLTPTKQGYGGTSTAGSTINFTNVDKRSSNGSSASLVLNMLATNGNPMSEMSQLVYLRDQPNPCSSFSEYSKNKPLTYNVVYFVDATNTLWRRSILQSNYDSGSIRCGSETPWQQPSCAVGYVSSSLPFCKTNDERLIEGVQPSDFEVRYYNSSDSESPVDTATNTSASDASRGAALLTTPTVSIKLTSKQTIAGRDVERSGILRATRLDTNASAIAQDVPVTSAPNAPAVSTVVSDGHVITATWPQVNGATSYEASYRINNGSWTGTVSNISNTTRTFKVTAGGHTDKVDVRVLARNSYGSSGLTVSSTTIPLWAPLKLQNGWTEYGNGYSSAGYTKTKAGLVMLKGLVKKPSAVTAGELIADALPSDYRPAGGALIFGVETNPNTWGRVDVLAGGHISASAASEGWVSLENIRYLASTESYTRTNVGFLNGWANYGGGYSPASYAQDSTGRVSVQGLVRSGTIADNTPIFNIPSSLAPSLYMHIANHTSGTGTGLFGVSTSNVQAKGRGANAYMSITASYVPASASITWSNIALQNGWVNYNTASFPAAQYGKANDGVVHLRGLIRAGTAGNILLGTLPANFRPKERILYYSTNNTEQARIDIAANGQIVATTSQNGWLSLDGISFMAEQ